MYYTRYYTSYFTRYLRQNHSHYFVGIIPCIVVGIDVVIVLSVSVEMILGIVVGGGGVLYTAMQGGRGSWLSMYKVHTWTLENI